MRTRLLMWLTRTCASARLCDGLVALLLLMTPAAFAQDVEDEITRRNDQAIELSRSGKLADAIRIWFELLDTTPADYSHRWVFHKNVGRNFQKLESHDRAWWHLDKARQSPDGEKSDQVKQWLAEEEAFLTKSGWVKVHLAAIGTGEFMPVSDELSRWYPLPSDWWFRPGLYQLPVRGAPGKEATADFTVHPGTVQLMLDVPQAPGTGTVLVVADQALAAIRIDDRPAGLGRAEVELEPGSHRVQVSLEGFLNWEKTLDVKEGERIEEAVRLQPVPPPVVAIEKGEDEGAETWAWVALASGAGLLAAGAGTYWGWGAAALEEQQDAHRAWAEDAAAAGTPPTEEQKDTDWEQRYDDHVWPAELTSYLLWGFGGAALATGSALLLTGRPQGQESADQEQSPTWRLLPSGGGADLWLEVRF